MIDLLEKAFCRNGRIKHVSSLPGGLSSRQSLSVCLFSFLSRSISLSPSVSPFSFCLSVSPSVCLFVCLSIYLSVSTCLPVFPFLCLPLSSLSLFVPVSVCLSLSIFLSLPLLLYTRFRPTQSLFFLRALIRVLSPASILTTSPKRRLLHDNSSTYLLLVTFFLTPTFTTPLPLHRLTYPKTRSI